MSKTIDSMKPAIMAQVFQEMGTPGDLQQVQVRHLWTDHVRVNVMVGKDAINSRIAHSFFLMVNKEGLILNSVPKIRKVY